VALVVALGVGYLIGFLVGRRKAAKGASKKPQQPQQKQPQQRREPRPEPSRPQIPAGSVELYVGNLSYDMTEDQLRQTFEAFGKVDSVRVVTNRYNNKSKGFAFVVMPNRAEAEKAIAEMNDKEVMGRPMRVNEAQNTNKAEA
jgi:RNA recognition motif-containing protein